MDKIIIDIPNEVAEILYRLNEAGYEAYIVGGCVRDSLMGNVPNDWDITTSAKPEEVKKVFKKTYDTGLQHGTVTVGLEDSHHEVTTYRTEGKYEDYRRPSQVDFVGDIKLDLGRRDFTINAIAYHPEEGFIDPYNGTTDIERAIIRSVRNPNERFKEDALRILRGVRFSAQLGFVIEENTLNGMLEYSSLLSHISKERIRDETVKILLSDRPEKFIDMYKWGLLTHVLPELIDCFNREQNHPHHIYDVGRHTIKAIKETPKDLIIRLTMLLHDIGKPYTHTRDEDGIDHFYGHVEKSVELTKKILRRLRFDNKTIKQVADLVKYHDIHLEEEMTRVNIKKVLSEIGPDLFDKLLIVQEADAKGQNPDKLEAKLDRLRETRDIFKDIIINQECYSLKDLEINGREVKNLGINEGREIGKALDYTLDLVINNPHLNNKNDLKQIIDDYKNNHM